MSSAVKVSVVRMSSSTIENGAGAGATCKFFSFYKHVGKNFSSFVCIFGFKDASTSQVIGARNEMIFGDLKLPDSCLTGEEKPRPGNLS